MVIASVNYWDASFVMKMDVTNAFKDIDLKISNVYWIHLRLYANISMIIKKEDAFSVMLILVYSLGNGSRTLIAIVEHSLNVLQNTMLLLNIVSKHVQ